MRHTSRIQRGLSIVAACLFIAIALLPQAVVAADYPTGGQAKSRTALRKGASSTSIVRVNIPKDGLMTVTGASGVYYKATYNGLDGYVLKSTVTLIENDVTSTTASGYPYATTTNAKVNVRQSPSTDAKILGTVAKGATVTVTGESGDFAIVLFEGKSAYIFGAYVNLKQIVAPTPEPTATLPPLPPGYETLSQGSTGDHVQALQEALKELGFFSGTPDGAFGAQTETAVIAFQRKNNLMADGAIDAEEQVLLYEKKPLNAKGAKVSVKTMSPIAGTTIRLNDQGKAVTKLHGRLKELGYYTGEITNVCTRATINAVKAFQRKNGLKADGLAGAETQGVLYSSAAIAANQTPTPKPTASPKPLPAAPTATVKSGSRGEAAKVVQTRLKELSYYDGKLDGIFGAGSVKALKAFQENNGLNADGIYGSGTAAVLFSVNALAAGATPTPVPTEEPTPSPTPVVTASSVVVQLGTQGTPVLNVQRRLTELGYYAARMDGSCLADDVAAIRAFQKANALTVDGKAGIDTQTVLFSEKAIGPSATATPAPAGVTTAVRYGDMGEMVTKVQLRLIALGYLESNADGKFGLATKTALIAFQRANSLTRDGIAGEKTQAKLFSSSAVAAAKTTPTASGSLKQGDMNNAVKEMQRMLISLGYLTGTADGDFGVKTYLALKAFQLRNGLTSDGIAGDKTLAALGSAAAKPAEGANVTPTPKPTAPPLNAAPSASKVRYAYWYAEVRARCKLYPYATIYDFSTGISWQVHMFSLGAHADAEPLTAADTAKMNRAFGGKTTWTPKAVWVVMSDGRVYLGSTHNTPHDTQHRTSNNFDGHLCIHFPRTMEQVTSIGPYATQHQTAIDAGWKKTLEMIH